MVLYTLTKLSPNPHVTDPVYTPNNLAAGLDPTAVVEYASQALAAWPSAFLAAIAELN
jgi:hypothetical protein